MPIMTRTEPASHAAPPEDGAAELEMRAVLVRGLEQWLRDAGLTQTAAAYVLGTTQARVSELKRGKVDQFSLALLVRIASRAGLYPRISLHPY